MRMALEQVIVLLFVDELLLESEIVAMEKGDLLPIECQRAECTETGNVNARRVARQRQAIPVGVAEDERGLQTGQEIDAAGSANIAAVKEVGRPGVLKGFDSRFHGRRAVMGVAQDADDHDAAEITLGW